VRTFASPSSPSSNLPARQRAALLLSDVLRWRAVEVAELLGTTVAAVNSALQRARATLRAKGAEPFERRRALDAAERVLLMRYLTAFEAYDVDALASIVQEARAP
jgi:RNA polymerase sigma-70 factor, ECF subfamily